MTRGDVARLLAYMAAFDKRTLGDADVLAWHDAIGDLEFEDAKLAVRDWYRENDGWVMPAHIRRTIRGSEADRHPSSRPAREVIAELYPNRPKVIDA